MAEPRLIADESQAVRADRVQVALVERELGVAIRAAPVIVRPGRAARRTAHDPRVVSLRLLNGHDVPTVTAKLAASPPPAGVVLAMAFRAGDEQTHGGTPEISDALGNLVLLSLLRSYSAMRRGSFATKIGVSR